MRQLHVLIFCVMAWSLAPQPLSAQERSDEHLLFQVIYRGDTALLKSLLRRGTPPDPRSDDGSTPLMIAALHGTSEMVELLLDHGADPHALNHRGVTALVWGGRRVEVVRLLLGCDADPNIAGDLGNTPLMVAAAAPDGAAAVRELLAHGADITLRNKAGRTALRNACGGGSTETVNLLLNRAQRQNQLEEVLRTAGPTVAIAAGNGYHDIVRILLDNGADADQSNGSRGHGLNAALLAGRTDIARTLIEHGTDLDCLTNPGAVPTVVLAAYSEVDDPTVATLLRAHGAAFEAASSNDETALTWARLRGHQELIDEVIQAGAPEGTLPARPAVPSQGIDSRSERTEVIAQAVQRSVDLLQLSSDTFLDVRRNCVSCHHQNLPGVAIAWARDRGFSARPETLERMMERQVESWKPRVDRAYELDSPYPVPPRFLGYGMWSFAETGYRPNDLTRAVSWFLAATQQPDGRWVPGMLRPPVGGDEILATMLAMRSLQLYPIPGRAHEMAERVDRARRWLAESQPRTHQEQVYRMLGLAWAGTEPDALTGEAQALLNAQRDDGGWAQLPGLNSDAWATGQTLVAIHIAGGLPTAHPAFQRGIDFLLSTQFDDGSWFVQSRSWPFQPYFESRFPHGRDQWVSAPATAWAVMALVLAVRPDEVARTGVQSCYSRAPAAAQVPPADTSATPLPAAVTRAVNFATDIRPILTRSCVGCHGDKDAESNFSLTSRAAVLRGGDSELPAVVPGDGSRSALVRFPSGIKPEMAMPPVDSRDRFPALSRDELSLLRAWVDQGAEWPAGVKLSVEE